MLEESIELIREHYPEPVDLAHLPPNDEKVYATLQKADTIGLFQVESRAQMSCLPRLKPKKFYDIVVQVAIIRPGPIVGKMPSLLEPAAGYEEAACLHPSLECFKTNTGVPLFQEQLLKIAMIAANFTGGEAEQLRRAMGFGARRAYARDRDQTAQRDDDEWNLGRDADRIVQSITSFACTVGIHAAVALIACSASEVPLSGGVHRGHAEQPAHGLLPSCDAGENAQRRFAFPVCGCAAIAGKCTIEGDLVRLGLNYVRGSRKKPPGDRRDRPFSSIVDLVDRVRGSANPSCGCWPRSVH